MYPKLRKNIEKDELMHNFTLSLPEKKLIQSIKKDKNKLGFTVLLKLYEYLGYFINNSEETNKSIVEYISNQLNIKLSLFNQYQWKGSTYNHHKSLIRDFTGFTIYNRDLGKQFIDRFVYRVENSITKINLSKYVIDYFKSNKVELPDEKEFRRIINHSYKIYYDSLYSKILQNISLEKRIEMEKLLFTNGEGDNLNRLKSSPGKLGMKTILGELEKLNIIRKINLNDIAIKDINPKIFTKLYNKVLKYDKSRLIKLKEEVKHALCLVFLYKKEKEVIDNIVDIFIKLIRKIENSSEKSVSEKAIHDIKKIYNKKNILKRLTFVITDNPDGIIKDVVFPIVGLSTLKRLVEEFENEDMDDFNTLKMKKMKSKYTHSYRKMMKPILDQLKFKTNNTSWNNILKSIDIIHKYIDTRLVFYPEDEDIPEEVIPSQWQDLVYHPTGEQKINKYYFELCLLGKLEKYIKCKEIYVEKAHRFRDPCEDLPKDWEINKPYYYDLIKAPLDHSEFILPIIDKLKTSLTKANKYFSKKRDVYIYHQKGKDRGFFRVPALKKQQESSIISNIKHSIINTYGIIDLLDVLIEADRQINFSKFFHHDDQRKVSSEKDFREKLLLSVFSLGTNLGLKRIHSSANPNCSYDDLLYFRKQFLNIYSLRECIKVLTNRILKVRNNKVWGYSTACASDGKQFSSYDQNLLSSSNPHYRKKGIMVYWHVDTNSTCIYSQLKHSNSSEVVSMIEGLIKHETEMKVASNYTDSRGQSEVAFAFCHFLKIRLLPRFKRIKYKTLYLPDKDKEIYPNLKTVINKSINWSLIASQYEEMVKHTAAIVDGTSDTEAILRRFSSYNDSHPTYKAFKELGRALCTIFLCEYLTSKKLRREVHEGLNVVENWNSANSFICYGNRFELSSNDPVIQEMTVLCLHLLQNAIILVNTILIDKVINRYNFLSEMTKKDFNSLTPLFTSNINPYGYFNLDFNKKSFLEVN